MIKKLRENCILSAEGELVNNKICEIIDAINNIMRMLQISEDDITTIISCDEEPCGDFIPNEMQNTFIEDKSDAFTNSFKVKMYNANNRFKENTYVVLREDYLKTCELYNNEIRELKKQLYDLKLCYNCKYYDNNIKDRPCNKCNDYSKWELNHANR